jgi:inhibitor of cysteine peptidase
MLSLSSFSYAENMATQEKPVVMVTANKPQFDIRLRSNPTTGYSWFLKKYNANLIEPVKHVFEAPQNKKLIGAPGYEVWTFRVKPAGFVVPHQTTIHFIYARPWEAVGSSTDVVFKVMTIYGS